MVRAAMPGPRPAGLKDGRLLLDEALESHRRGRYLAAAIVLGTCVESMWFEAARLLEPNAPNVATALAVVQPTISKVQDEVVSVLQQGGRSARYLGSNLDAWARSTRTVRNFGAHGNVVSARTGAFTETASAMRIVDCYRHLDELEQALQEMGV